MNVKNIERVNQRSKAAKILTILTAFVGMPLCALLLSSFWTETVKDTPVIPPVIVASPSPQPTEVMTLVNMTLVHVEYQIGTVDPESLQTISLWYTSETGGKNRINSRRIAYARPFTETVMVNQGEYIEVVAIPVNQGMGKLTCRILVDNVLVEQSTSRRPGSGVYCSGVATP